MPLNKTQNPNLTFGTHVLQARGNSVNFAYYKFLNLAYIFVFSVVLFVSVWRVLECLRKYKLRAFAFKSDGRTTIFRSLSHFGPYRHCIFFWFFFFFCFFFVEGFVFGVHSRAILNLISWFWALGERSFLS